MGVLLYPYNQYIGYHINLQYLFDKIPEFSIYKIRINFWWFCQGNGCSIFLGFNSPVRNLQALPRLPFGCPLMPRLGHPCPDSNGCSGVDLGRERGIRTGVRSGGGAPSTKFFAKRAYPPTTPTNPIQAFTSWYIPIGTINTPPVQRLKRLKYFSIFAIYSHLVSKIPEEILFTPWLSPNPNCL